MKRIKWSGFDEEADPEESGPVRTKVRKRFDEYADEISRRQKKSSKRYHRRKTLKDEPWEE